MNFSDAENKVVLDREYKNVVTGETISGETALPVCGYLVLEQDILFIKTEEVFYEKVCL